MSTIRISSHLNKATEDYPEMLAANGIAPISETDMMIIAHVIAILEKDDDIEVNQGFLEALKDYKRRPDQALLDYLDYFVDSDEPLLQQEYPITFIVIKDFTLRADRISSMRPVERWVGDDYQFCILINEEPLPMKDQFYMNTYIKYETEQQRNEELTDLKNRLEQKTNVRFL